MYPPHHLYSSTNNLYDPRVMISRSQYMSRFREGSEFDPQRDYHFALCFIATA